MHDTPDSSCIEPKAASAPSARSDTMMSQCSSAKIRFHPGRKEFIHHPAVVERLISVFFSKRNAAAVAEAHAGIRIAGACAFLIDTEISDRLCVKDRNQCTMPAHAPTAPRKPVHIDNFSLSRSENLIALLPAISMYFCVHISPRPFPVSIIQHFPHSATTFLLDKRKGDPCFRRSRQGLTFACERQISP